MVENQTQLDKFKAAAKELECNESERDFDEKLKVIATKRDEDKAPASSKKI